MVAIGTRLTEGLKEIASKTPMISIRHAGYGFIYSTIANLPLIAVVQAWIIWGIASSALTRLISALTENPLRKMEIHIFSIILSPILAVQEMSKRKLIGNGLTVCLLISTLYKLIYSLDQYLTMKKIKKS